MKVLILFLNILCFKCCVSMLTSNSELQMIVDVIKSYDKPTAVVAKLCRKSSSHKLKLAKMLADPDKPISVRYLEASEFIENYNFNCLFFVIDIHCEDTRLFLNQALSKRMFSRAYRWLILGNHKQRNDIVATELEDLNISIDSEVIVARENEKKDIVLHTIYKIKPNSKWIIEYYGAWSFHYGLNKSEDRSLSNFMRRKNFRGEPITTSIVIADNRTRTDLLGLGNIFVDTLAKSSYRCINPVYDFFNATRDIIYSDTWGYLINGTWNGMIGDLNQEKADLCGSVTFITKERMTVLEYLTHPTPITAKFVFRQPPLSYQNNLYMLPFTVSVWYCAGAFVVILIVILYINTKWDIKKYKEYEKRKMDQTCLPPTWNDITIFVLSAIFQQGSSNELKGTLGRLVMFIVFLAFLFIYTSYSANIVALLQSTSNQIRTLSDLLNSKLELGIEDVPYNRYYFSADYVTGDPVRKAILETKVAPKGKPNYMSIEKGIKEMQKKPFAFNMNTGTGYRIVSALFQEHEKCGLQEIEFIQNSNPWMCCKRHSPYSEMYKVGFIRVQEHGLTDRENRLVYTKKPACSTMGGNFGSVNMVDFYPVCLMLLYGMILAFVLLGIEILVHRRQNKKRPIVVEEI